MWLDSGMPKFYRPTQPGLCLVYILIERNTLELKYYRFREIQETKTIGEQLHPSVTHVR